jgi:hypothetical protein
MRKIISLVLVLTLVLTLAACGGSLSGAYVDYPGDEFSKGYVFSGNKVAYGQYEYDRNRAALGADASDEEWKKYWDEVKAKGLIFYDQRNGTYSISGEQIEIVWANGNIEVLSFSSTQNTVTIDRVLYKKQ